MKNEQFFEEGIERNRENGIFPVGVVFYFNKGFLDKFCFYRGPVRDSNFPTKNS